MGRAAAGPAGDQGVQQHLCPAPAGSRPAGGTPGRIALPVAGDDPAAKAVVIRLIDELGFDGVDAGGLDESWRQQPGTPVYGTDLRRRGRPAGAGRGEPGAQAGVACHGEQPGDFHVRVTRRGREARPGIEFLPKLRTGGGPMPDVVIYTKSWCGYCTRAKALLARKGVAFTEVEISDNDALRDEIVARAGGRTDRAADLHRRDACRRLRRPLPA